MDETAALAGSDARSTTAGGYGTDKDTGPGSNSGSRSGTVEAGSLSGSSPPGSAG